MMDSRAKELIDALQMKILPGEGTYIRELYRSAGTAGELSALSTTYGLYCADPPSRSNFHRLSRDEAWSWYEGDPLDLFLLLPDGSTQTVTLGRNAAAGQAYQFTIPAGTWQAGRLRGNGGYALYGCTVAPAFTPDCFELGNRAALTAQYPGAAEIITELTEQ